MECKFKQIVNFQGAQTLPVRSTQTAVNGAINCLLGNVADHVYNKTAMQRSKVFLKNKIINFEIDSVKQVYPPRPTIPNLLMEEESPRKANGDCMRPMSAQVRSYRPQQRRSTIMTDSKKTIDSHKSLASHMRSKRNTTSVASSMESTSKKRKYYRKQTSNQKRFFAVKSNYDDDQVHAKFIEQLRLKKLQEENQLKKKEEFLKSIQLQSTSYTTAQAKFVQSINRKKFIYGLQGQIIQINGNAATSHLKKISAMSKSKVQTKPKTNAQLINFQQELKENIYIEFKGRQIHQSRPETGKPYQSQKTQDFKNKFLSLKQTKRQPDQGLKQLLSKNNSNTKTPTQRQNQSKRGMSQQGITKKKIQKILFYQSPNSFYRVVNDNNCHDINGKESRINQ